MKTMKKSRYGVAFAIMLLLVLNMVFSACGCNSAGASGNAKITSNWRCVETMVNGKVSRMDDVSPIIRLFSMDMEPKFKVSKDGSTCVLSMAKKSHKGTITEEDGKYIIDFDDTYANLIGEISGNKLVLVNEKGTVSLVFEKK